MKNILKFCFVLSVMLSTSCTDQTAILDSNHEITGRNWSYTEKVRMEFVIVDPTTPYNVYVNLRHTGDYKYSNIFLLIHTTGPDGKKVTERREFRLAMPDGEWLGSGSGNLYSCQMPWRTLYRFPAAGKYTVELEQNMRNNPLQNIADVGLRVEKAE